MTADENATLKDDITFLRSLAEAGKSRPLGGGAGLVLAGLLFGSAAFLSWLELAGIARMGIPVPAFWFAALALGFAIWLLIVVRFGSVMPAGPSTRAFVMAWNGIGVGILVLAIANALAVWKYRNGVIEVLQAPTVICLYGIAWFISSGLVKRWWFLGVALTCFAFSIVLVLLPFPTFMLGFAVAIVSTALIPGLYLMMGEPR